MTDEHFSVALCPTREVQSHVRPVPHCRRKVSSARISKRGTLGVSMRTHRRLRHLPSADRPERKATAASR